MRRVLIEWGLFFLSRVPGREAAQVYMVGEGKICWWRWCFGHNDHTPSLEVLQVWR